MEVGKKFTSWQRITGNSWEREHYLLPTMRPLKWLTNTNTQMTSYMSNKQTNKQRTQKVVFIYVCADVHTHTRMCVFVRLIIKDKNDVNLRVGYMGSITERRTM